MPFTFEQVFLAALLFYFLVHTVICTAEIVHLNRTIFKVPDILQHKVPLALHIKATRYDLARTKLNLLEVISTSAVILVLTKFHGIDYLSEFLMNQVGDLFAFHWMLPALLAFIFLLVDLPFTWQREFRLREAFGYTREQPRRWLMQFILTSLLGWLAVLPLLWIGLWFWRQSGSLWWLVGWGFFSIYLIFPLHLARRLYYLIRPAEAQPIDNPDLFKQLKEMGARANIQITDIRITQSEHNEELPPAFAFGHRKKVRIFIRNDVYQKLSTDSLTAISAHALARNLSHMYLQAWLVCSLVGLLVFAFLAWLAPQSWFLDEIGFKAIGPGPYYGSLLAFAIVALPVLLFPLKLPMEAFLRHLIFRSDIFASHYAGLGSITNALIELTPTPIRHSCLTLESFDLLFSHEPSLMARLNRIRKDYARLKKDFSNKNKIQSKLELFHTIENVQSAIKTQKAQEKYIESLNKELEQQKAAQARELKLVEQAMAQRVHLKKPLGDFIDSEPNNNEQDNTLHRTYHMGLIDGFIDLLSRLNEWQRNYRLHHRQQSLSKKIPKGSISKQAVQIDPFEKLTEKKHDQCMQQNTGDRNCKTSLLRKSMSEKRQKVALDTLKQREKQLSEKNHGKIR